MKQKLRGFDSHADNVNQELEVIAAPEGRITLLPTATDTVALAAEQQSAP